jgi:hypothetical protein
LKIVPHEHHQGITMTRMQTSASLGLGSGWQVIGRLPIDAKFMSIDYTTPDGQPYTPPYGNIHHRNETLAGFGDAQLEIQHFTRSGESWVIGAGVGLTIPLGRTEENPYALTEQGESHQHMQMGSGTVAPIFSASALWMGHQWGGLISSNGRLPMAANSKGYRPSSSIQLSAGPSYRFTSKLMMTSSLSLTRESQAEWQGIPDPMSGSTVVMGGGAVIFRFTPMLASMVQVRTTIAHWSEKPQIRQNFIGSVGLSWTPGGKGSLD